MGHSYPRLIRSLECWSIYALCAIVCLIVTSGAHAAEPRPAKRVLLISTGSRFSPGFALVDQAVLEALGKIASGTVEVYPENLDILRFPSERFARIFSEYLTEKYAEQPPDLVILVYIGNLGTAGKLLQQLFPRTPVIVAGFTEEEVPRDQFGSLVSGVAQRVDPRATIGLILRLQPETRRIVVIGGTAEVDRSVLNRVKDAARSFAGRVDFVFLDNRSLGELRQATSALPPQTAILFSRMFRDGAGQAVISTQAGQSIVQWANAPVYLMTDTPLGTGAVGGSIASVEAFGKRAGEMARLILSGTAPASLPFEIRTDTVPTFDWRALQRWGISESRLPPNSIVRFRPPSLWEEYRWYILGALFIFALQGAMIADLLLQRRRRRRAEADRKRAEERFRLAVEASPNAIVMVDGRGKMLLVNALTENLFGYSREELIGQTVEILAPERFSAGHPAHRAAFFGAPQARTIGVGRDLFARRKDGSEFLVEIGLNPIQTAEGILVLTAIVDITERKRVELELQRQREELAHVTRVSTVGELTTSVAHELNQPLGAILSNAEAAEMFLQADPPALDEVREILADIRKDDERASEVIWRMRSLLRKHELAPQSIEINDAVK